MCSTPSPSKPNIPVAVNTVEHNAYQEQINNYLQGKPDDVFAWFAGNRMQFFAAQGLSMPIDDIWQKVGANYSDAMKSASTGADGHQYFIPIYNYPWAVFYRKSLFSDKGYQDPEDAGRPQDARDPDAEGRPDAVRLRRQARLAGYGHLRHPQHAR